MRRDKTTMGYGIANDWLLPEDRYRYEHYRPRSERPLVFYKGKWIPLEEYNRLPPDDKDFDLDGV
jgi:hypothetical protein